MRTLKVKVFPFICRYKEFAPATKGVQGGILLIVGANTNNGNGILLIVGANANNGIYPFFAYRSLLPHTGRCWSLLLQPTEYQVGILLIVGANANNGIRFI